MLDTGRGAPGPADCRRAGPLEIEENDQLVGLDSNQVIRWRSRHRWSALCMLACIYLAVAVAGLRRLRRPGDRPDPGYHPLNAAYVARHGRPTASPGPRPLPAPAAMATPPPVQSQPSPPALECLRKRDTVITTNYSCLINGGRS